MALVAVAGRCAGTHREEEAAKALGVPTRQQTPGSGGERTHPRRAPACVIVTGRPSTAPRAPDGDSGDGMLTSRKASLGRPLFINSWEAPLPHVLALPFHSAREDHAG